MFDSATFEVMVTSVTLTHFFRIVNVHIQIQDINDNAPRFPTDVVTVYISESVNVGSEFRITEAKGTS